MNLDKPTKYCLPSPVTFNHNNGTWAKYYSDHYGRTIKILNSEGSWIIKKWDGKKIVRMEDSYGWRELLTYNEDGKLIRKSVKANKDAKPVIHTYKRNQ